MLTRNHLLPAVVACLLFSSAALAQAPSITHTVPAGVMPGKATDVTLYGANLAGAKGLWTSFGGQAELAPDIEKNGTEAGKVTFRITLPEDAAVGIGGLRVATDKGVSNLRLLLVDDLPSVADNGKNKSREAAQELTLPVAVDGTCEPVSFDYYKLAGKAGQRVSVEVFARRLGSALDPTVRLLDASGRELAYSDDEAGIGADCRLSHTLPADGTYLIELRDIRYQGGGGHRYRLRVGDFPLVTTAYPLAVERGSSAAAVQVVGPDVADAAPMEVTMPGDAGEAIYVGARRPGGGGSAPVAILASDLSEQLESEPNDKLEASTAVTLPGGINGRFEKDKDRDYFKFEGNKGQRFVFAGQGRSLGAPSDLFLRLYDAGGKKLAEAEDAGTEEGRINYTLPADGTYHLMVEDLLRRGGPELAYRVEARPYQPGFALSLEVDKLDVPQGGVFVAKVVAARDGYNGPIALELDGAGEGFQLAAATIAEKKNDTTIRVTVPQGLEPGTLLNLGIVGKAKIGEKEVSAKASTLVALRKWLAGLAYPPRTLLTSVGVGVGQPFPDFFSISAQPVTFPRVVGQATFKVTAKRMNKFGEAINLAVEGLPEGFEAKVAPIAKGKGDVAITVTGPADAAAAEHAFTVKGSATFQNQPKSVVLGGVALRIVEPLAVSVAAPAAMAPGGKQTVKISVTRHGHQGEVALELVNLPKGVTAPPDLKIAGDKNEIDVELTAAGDAAAAKAEDVVVVAKTKVKDQDISVQSSPVTLEVEAP